MPLGTTPGWGQKSQGAAIPYDLPRFRAKNRKGREGVPESGMPQGHVGWADLEPMLQSLRCFTTFGTCGVRSLACLRPVGR